MQTQLLKLVAIWQRMIDAHLSSQYPELTAARSHAIQQSLIINILWLFLCDQRGVPTAESLAALSDRSHLYAAIIDRLTWISHWLEQPPPLPLPPDLELDDRLLSKILFSLYTPNPRQFVALPCDSLGWVYEQSLADYTDLDRKDTAARHQRRSAHRFSKARKSGGVYYTPAPIVRYMVQQTVALWRNQPPNGIDSVPASGSRSLCYPRVIDPACGGGAFLLAAYADLLADWKQHHDLTPADSLRILTEHIYGVDVDPRAAALTRAALVLKYLEVASSYDSFPIPKLQHSIRWGNAIVHLQDTQANFMPSSPPWHQLQTGCGLSSESIAGSSTSTRTSAMTSLSTGTAVIPNDGLFTWQRAFTAIIQSGGFDVILSNPPYIDSEWMTTYLPYWRRYCSQYYQTAIGNWDLFCIFVEQAIQLCRTDGLISLIVPNKLASADYAAATRQRLSQQTRLLAIRDYSQVPVFTAAVYPLVYVAQKSTPPPDALVQYELMQTIDQIQEQRSIALSSLAVDRPWLLGTAAQSSLMQRLDRCPTLGTLASVAAAATVAEAYSLKPLIQEKSTLTRGDFKLVNSGTIDRYAHLWGRKPLRYLGKFYQHPVIPQQQQSHLPPRRCQQAVQVKLIVAGMTQRLECIWDETGTILAGKSTSIIHSHTTDLDWRYFLALLNSHLLSVYFNHRFAGHRLQGGYFRSAPPQLRQLPIALPNLTCVEEQQRYQHLLSLVDDRLQIQQCYFASQTAQEQAQWQAAIEQTDHQIDQLVYQHYRLTDAEIEQLMEDAIDR